MSGRPGRLRATVAMEAEVESARDRIADALRRGRVRHQKARRLPRHRGSDDRSTVTPALCARRGAASERYVHPAAPGAAVPGDAAVAGDGVGGAARGGRLSLGARRIGPSTPASLQETSPLAPTRAVAGVFGRRRC